MFENACIHSCTLRNKKYDVHNPDPRTPPLGDRCPAGHCLRHGPLVAPDQHLRVLFHWKRTPARIGAEAGKSPRLPGSQKLPKISTSGLIPRFFNLPGENFGHILSVVAIRSWSGLSSDCGSIHKHPDPSWGPGFGNPHVPIGCVRPLQGGRTGYSSPRAPSRGLVSCLALGLPGHLPKGGVTRYPPSSVFRGCSRPVRG